ncbi:MAG: response regulator transcription factor [Clostridia bacterium]|nr:response regulator transcription factor [Clostridia bacterium]
MFKIMIIEDDEKLKNLMEDCLKKYGYNTVCVEDFQNVEDQFEREKPHMVLLDINLPYFDGFYLCRILRRKSNIPIIIVSARNSEMEQVMGIELGADDYVIKPFSIELLIVKVKAALRRVYGEYSVQDTKAPQAEGLTLDEGSFKMQYKGLSIELSKNELKLLKKLLENKNKIVSREDLLAELWDDSSFVDDNTLTVNVTRVKSKLGELGITDVIKTKRGAGYLLDTTSMEDVSHG